MAFLNDMLAKHEIVRLQNHPANLTQDHVSICGFFTTEAEFEEHAAYLRENIYRAIPVVELGA